MSTLKIDGPVGVPIKTCNECKHLFFDSEKFGPKCGHIESQFWCRPVVQIRQREHVYLVSPDTCPLI